MAAAAFAAGCGGGREDTSSVASHVKTEFVKRANAVCEREKAGLAGKESAFLKLHSSDREPFQERYADMVHFILLPMIEAQIVRIERLGAPVGEEGRIGALISSQRLAIDYLAGSARIASPKAVANRFKASSEMFRAYGLASCANGPKL
jgi:hypothetical protein